MRNFHSLVAFLQGLRAAGFEQIPPELFKLVNEQQNYRGLREALKAGPGVPFLFVCRKGYVLHGERCLSELLSALASYPDPASFLDGPPPSPKQHKSKTATSGQDSGCGIESSEWREDTDDERGYCGSWVCA